MVATVQSWYQVLGVPHGASDEQIRLSYRRLLSRHHPDKNRSEGAAARFKLVRDAYEILGIPERRRAYDLVLRKQAAEATRGAANKKKASAVRGNRPQASKETVIADFGEIFRGIFRKRQAGEEIEKRDGQDLRARVFLDLESAFRGGMHKITLPADSHDGKVGKSLEVSLPSGVKHGQLLRFRAQGHSGRGGGRTGDLVIEICINTHDRFRVSGRDLHMILPITPSEAALGAQIKVPGLDRSYQISIPANCRNGTIIKVAQAGYGNSRRGDLILKVEVVLPEAGTAELRRLYKRLDELAAKHPREGWDE